MFEKGTRILILASTRRKGAGPRKGSVGYVSTCVHDEYSRDFIASSNEVFFTRYGFEESKRMERKHIISVFPVTQDGEDVPTQVKSCIRRIISPKNDKTWNELRSSFGAALSVPIVIAVPDSINKINLVEDDDIEFKAWAQSILYNPWFLHKAHETLMRGHFKNAKDALISEFNLNKLREMSNDKDYRSVVLSDISSDRANKEHFINIIRLFTVLFGVKDHRDEMVHAIREIRSAFGKEKGLFRRHALPYLSSHLFNSVDLMVVQESAKIANDKEFKSVVDMIMQTRSELLRLSSRLEMSE